MHKLLLLCLLGAASARADCGASISTVLDEAKLTAVTAQAAAKACKGGATKDCLAAVGTASTAIAALQDGAVTAVGQCGVSGDCYANVKVVADTIKTANTQIVEAASQCDKEDPAFNEGHCAEAVLGATGSVVKASLYGYNAVKVCTGGDPHSCLAEVLELIQDTQDAVQQIVGAAKDCRNKDSACGAEVGQAASALAATVQFGITTAEKCNVFTHNSCVSDISDAMTKLGATGTALQSTVATCKGFSLACVKQVVALGMDVVAIGVDVVKATKDCSIPVVASEGDALDDCLKSVFTTATDGMSTVNAIADSIKTCGKGAGAECAAAASKSVASLGGLDQDVAGALGTCRLAGTACAGDLTQAGKAIAAAAAVFPDIQTNCSAIKTDKAAAQACMGELLKVSGDAGLAVTEFVIATGDCGKQTALTVCLKNVLTVIGDVQAASRAVAAAINSCKAKSQSCASDIESAVDAAVAAVDAGVTAGEQCKAFPLSACVTDITSAVDGVRTVADDLKLVQTSCKDTSNLEACVVDLLHVVEAVIGVAKTTGKAFTDCRV